MRTLLLTCLALSSILLGACGGGGGGLAVKTAASTPDAIHVMRQGEAVAVLGDYPAMAYAARESAGRMTLVGGQFQVEPYAMAMGQDADALEALVTQTLNSLILNGTYRRILETWALEAGAAEPIEGASAAPPVDQIPQLADGKLTVGMEIAYAPMEFIDEAGMNAGIDVELVQAIGQAMGVEVELRNVPFEELFGELSSGGIDLAISSITVTPERSQAARLVPYFLAGSGILVPAANPAGIEGPRDLCDHAVAVQAGTVHVEMLRRECP
ncbi:MAG: transporter substrate-binding domain-containing protein [Deltaproteobacteria bacterium]|nr:transporter substrate-binding domain-containing protein [Deltaproteobacteria bacterium]